MAEFSIQIDCHNDEFLENKIFCIEQVEKFFFQQNLVTPNSAFKWILRIEDHSNCPQLVTSRVDSIGSISVGIDFLKKTYMITHFLLTFYAENLENKAVNNDAISAIFSKKRAFSIFCDDEKNWKKIKEKGDVQNVNQVFFNVVHFFINHEIGHTIHIGDNPDIENKCDDEAIVALVNQIKAINIKNGNVNWGTLVCDSKDELVKQIVSGGIIAQAVIAYFEKKGKYGAFYYDEKEKKNSLHDHSYTYERIENFIDVFNKLLRRKKIALDRRSIDNCFAYILMSIAFMYNQFNFNGLLENHVDYESVCKQIFEMLKLFPQDKLIEIFSKPRFCYDEVIGFAKNSSGKWSFKRRCDYGKLFVPAEKWNDYYNNSAYGDPIVFVLESPHKSEFFKRPIKIFLSDLKIYARPAKGQTKRFFDANFSEVFKNLDVVSDSKLHPVIIVNACRFQCSLGKKISWQSTTRDENFKKLFESDIDNLNKCSLVQRIERLSPYVLINACTKGNDEKYILRDKVDSVLPKKSANYFFRTCHPVSWRNPDYRFERKIEEEA